LNPLATVRCGTAADVRLRRAICLRQVTQVAQESSRSKRYMQAMVPDRNPRPIRRQDHDSAVAAAELSLFLSLRHSAHALYNGGGHECKGKRGNRLARVVAPYKVAKWPARQQPARRPRMPPCSEIWLRTELTIWAHQSVVDARGTVPGPRSSNRNEGSRRERDKRATTGSRAPRVRESRRGCVGLAGEGMRKRVEWRLAGPNGVLAFFLFTFYFLFSLFKFNLNSNLIQTFCGSSLKIRFVNLRVLILETFIYIYYLLIQPFILFFSPHL
jgi:hypothetical protein